MRSARLLLLILLFLLLATPFAMAGGYRGTSRTRNRGGDGFLYGVVIVAAFFGVRWVLEKTGSANLVLWGKAREQVEPEIVPGALRELCPHCPDRPELLEDGTCAFCDGSGAPKD